MNQLRILLLAWTIILSTITHAKDNHDEHGEHAEHAEEEHGATRFGPHKAITAANKKDGIKLSPSALKTLGIESFTLRGNTNRQTLPLKAVVFFQDELGVYRMKDGWFKLIEVSLISKTSTEAIILSDILKSGDHITLNGVPLLRAAELEAWGGSGDGHGH